MLPDEYREPSSPSSECFSAFDLIAAPFAVKMSQKPLSSSITPICPTCAGNSCATAARSRPRRRHVADDRDAERLSSRNKLRTSTTPRRHQRRRAGYDTVVGDDSSRHVKGGVVLLLHRDELPKGHSLRNSCSNGALKVSVRIARPASPLPAERPNNLVGWGSSIYQNLG